MYRKKIETSLIGIIIYCRNVQTTAGFYSEALGLQITLQSDQLVQLKDQSNSKIVLKQVTNESFLCRGYSPLLNLSVQDLIRKVDKLKNYGAILDGDIVETEDQKLAVLRAPDGEIICLTQNKPNYQSDDSDQEVQNQSSADKEIIRILEKLKI